MKSTCAQSFIPIALAIALALSPFVSGCGGERHEVRNLIVISVDTLRADHLGAYGSQRNLSPNIDALARESLVFEYAYATAPFTLASLSSLLTGRYPDELGVDWNRSVLAPEVPTLASVLRGAGWRTGAVVSNFVLRARKSGIDVGFDHFDSTFPQLEAVRKFPERTAAATTDAALVSLDRLNERDEADARPFFLWVHYQDPHGPYTPSKDTRERFFDRQRAQTSSPQDLAVGRSKPQIGVLPSYQFIEERHDLEFYRAGYEAEIFEADAAIGVLVDALRERGLLDTSLVVLVADHGESLGEDDYWFAHGEFLSDALVRIPLLLRVPGRPAAERADVASLVDLVPTVAGFFEIADAPATSGRDLLASESRSKPVYFSNLNESSRPRVGIVADGYRYIVTPRIPKDRGGRGPKDQELRRLGAPDQPLEKSHAAQAKAMRNRILSFREHFEIPKAPAAGQELTPLEEAQLKALGYVDGDGDE
jgi:arylsulfatase A-like enzyme